MMLLKHVWRWFTLRWPFNQLKHILLDEEIKGGSSYAYTFGSSIFAMVSLQVASGIVQLFYYVPTTDHAYDSVSYLRTEVPFGWLVHNIHYWGARLMVALVVLHMIRVYIWGAYKSQLTWLIGVGLLLTTMALTFTGGPLIWDLKGFWAGEVGSSITGTVPLVGGIMKTILRGREGMGQLMLSRFFAIHVAVLVPSLFILIMAHVASFRATGIVGSWNKEKRREAEPFWPDQLFKDAVVFTSVIFLLLVLAVFYPAPFTGPADPFNTTYLPKPEWNFLFLYQALKYFKGPLEPVGTVGVPTLLISLLVLLPFIDRHPERNPSLRPVAMLGLALYAATILTFTLIGYFSPGYAEMPAAPAPAIKQTSVVSPSAAERRPAKEITANSPVPDPQTNAEAAAAAGSAIVEEPPGRAAFYIGNADNGAVLFKDRCTPCHGQEAKGGVPNPGSADKTVPPLNPIDRELFNTDPKVFAKNIDRYIQHGSVPEGPAPVLKMLPFGDSNALTQEEISNIEAYVLRLNHVDRSSPIDPGMQPKRFFYVTAFIYGAVALMLFAIWNTRIRRRPK